MVSKSLCEQVKCRWREFRREPSAFFWVVFMPIVWMLALGFAFSNPKPETYGVGWLEPENMQAELARTMESALSTSQQIKLLRGSTNDLDTMFQRGEIALVVTTDQERAIYRYDSSNPEAVRARNFVDDLIQSAAGRRDQVKAVDETLRAAGGRYVDFLVPGLLGLSIMTSSLFGVGMTIVANRRENLLKRYLATPMRPYEYIVSHIVGRYMVLAAEFIAVMVTGYLIFGFKVFGNYLSYMIIAALGAAAFTAIALLCASRTKSIPMVSGLTNLISLPMMMLSGVFFSKNNFPDWLRSVVDYLPLTALNDGLRKIALEGKSISSLGTEIAVLAAYTVVATVATTKLFRWF